MRTRRYLVYAALLLLAVLPLTGCFGGGGGKSVVTTLEGTFKNEFGHPVPGANLVIGQVTGQTKSDGSFRLSGVTAGAQTLTVTRNGYVGRTMPVQVTAGKANRVTDNGGGSSAVLRTIHSLAAERGQIQAAADTAPHTACSGCHAPRGGIGPDFLKANDQAICNQPDCHVAPDGGTWEHPASHLDNTLIKPSGELAVYDRIGCLRCHISHAGPGESLTPGFPTPATPGSYTSYCTTCHNATLPGSQFDPATHNPGTSCTACHANNGLASCPHGSCARSEAGCHGPSATLPLAAAHRGMAGGCTGCHDLAGSRPNLLKSAANTLCGQVGCHGEVTSPPQSQHSSAGCDGCHSIHQTSPTPDAKCLRCHTSVNAERMAGTSTHDVACGTCHNGHVVTAAQKVTNPFTQAAYPYSYESGGAFCLLCHGLGPDYMGYAEVEAGAPAVEEWPGAINIVPELLVFESRTTTFWIGLRIGGITAPWQDTNMNGHYAHWGNNYRTPPPGWPYEDRYGNTSMPDPCVYCHGVHAGRDPKIVREIDGYHSDWTLYRPDHQYDCHYACHAPLTSAAGLSRTLSAKDSGHSIEAAIAKRAGGLRVRRKK